MAACDSGTSLEMPPPVFTVTFNSLGGSLVGAQEVAPGEKVSRPGSPARIDHSFVGWFTAPTGGTVFDFYTAITADKTVYARWIYTPASPPLPPPSRPPPRIFTFSSINCILI